MKRLLHMIRKEVIQLRQDRKMIPVLLAAPLIQLVVLGFAANMDVTDVPLLLVDNDRTRASRELCERFTGSRYFHLAGAEDSPEAVGRWLTSGRAQVALVIREGYGEAAAAGRTPEVQVIADGTEANSAVVGLGYASTILAAKSGELVAARAREMALKAARNAGSGAPAGGAVSSAGTASGGGTPAAFTPPGRITLIPRIWYNPDLRSRWFYVPAILAMVLMLTTMILPSMAVVREKEIGTLEQIMVTPLRSWQLIVGKLLPFAVIGMLNLTMITALAVWLFGVPLRGSFPLLVLMSLLFLMTTLGLGLLASTLVRTQQQAMMTSIFLLMVPMIYLSGLIFPIENMPQVIQYGAYGIPLRYYNNALRGIFLRGAGLSTLWPEAAVLTAYGLAILTLASMRFRKRLD